jgi:hypothetical protein
MTLAVAAIKASAWRMLIARTSRNGTDGVAAAEAAATGFID